jgi:hypothetical protein
MHRPLIYLLLHALAAHHQPPFPWRMLVHQAAPVGHRGPSGVAKAKRAAAKRRNRRATR